MARDIQEPTLDERGNEVHPAFGMISAHRVSSGGAGGGAVLFDSDIRHGHYVTVLISTADRKRDLNSDWIHSDKDLIEVAMSEAQWASFVSSMNTSGVPCTIERKGYEMLPGLPYAPRLAVSMQETHEAADRIFDRAQEAMERYEEALKTGTAKEKREALSTLKATLRNSTPNVDFAAKRLAEHAEDVVQKARADIEAMVTQKAAQLGIDTNTHRLELDAGFGRSETPPAIEGEQ